MSEKIKVMLVDDHTTFRQPLAFMLEQERDIAVVAQADSLSEAGKMLEKDYLQVDVAIVDLDLPDGSGTTLIRNLRDTRPRAIALVLSGLTERAQVARAIVIEALRLVVRERERDHEAQLAIKQLTPRGLEVLQALSEGLSDKDIAEQLHIGIGTVHTHVTNILSKLGVASRLQALVFAVRHGLVVIS